MIGNQYGTPGEWGRAEMDDLRIYSWALTAAEIQEIYREAPHLVATPTLTEWGTIVLIMLLGIAAVYHLQEQRMSIQ